MLNTGRGELIGILNNACMSGSQECRILNYEVKKRRILTAGRLSNRPTVKLSLWDIPISLTMLYNPYILFVLLLSFKQAESLLHCSLRHRPRVNSVSLSYQAEGLEQLNIFCLTPACVSKHFGRQAFRVKIFF